MKKMVVSCGFIIENVDGKILIAHPTGDINGLGIWTFPKGQKEIGETDLECAYREVYEETNLKLEKINGEVSFFGNSIRNNREVILYHFKSNEDLTKKNIKCNSLVEYLDIYEMDDYKWVSIEESLNYLGMREQNMIENEFMS